ncbi:MAG: hypothetical protein NT133_25330 [Alphaproteobacteria bacterium]|nr:hypothetical protein [Alphaproteobacteria bacterium]
MFDVAQRLDDIADELQARGRLSPERPGKGTQGREEEDKLGDQKRHKGNHI